MLKMGRLFWINIFFFSLYGIIVFFYFLFDKNSVLQTFKSLAALIILFPLLGINLSIFLEKIFSQKFDLLEKIISGVILSFILSPSLLTLEYSLFTTIFPELPFINALLLFFAAFLFNPFSFETETKESEPFKEKKTSDSWMIFLSSASYIALIWIIVSAYHPLPDYDPYYWLPKFNTEFSQNILTSFHLSRPLFSSFSYIFNQTAQIDLYTFYKYIFPFLFLLTLLPAVLLSRFYVRTTSRFALYLLPLASASAILYSLMPIPQALLNICIAFFIYFLLYSLFSQKQFFYFLAGAIIFGAYFYHEAALLIFLPWFGITVYSYRYSIFKKIRENKLSSTFVFLLLLSYGQSLFIPMYTFLSFWLTRIAVILPQLQINLSFPLVYTNVDGNQVGWGNWIGVVKYYLFYAGPTVFFILFLLFIGIFYLRKTTVQKRFLEYASQKEVAVLVLSFLLFFILAEILPRFFSFALFPERAWGFAGFFIIAFFLLFIREFPHKYPWLVSIFIATVILNMGSATYINSFKKYLITPEQLASAEWIKAHLPKDRIFFTRGNINLLEVHSQSEYINVGTPLFYSDLSVFNAHYVSFSEKEKEIQLNYDAITVQLEKTVRQLKEKNPAIDTEIISKNVLAGKQHLDSIEKLTIEMKNFQKKRGRYSYIYYAKTSEKNIYASRPYFEKDKNILIDSFPFDNFPDRFQRIYIAPNNAVIIWQVTEQ